MHPGRQWIYLSVVSSIVRPFRQLTRSRFKGPPGKFQFSPGGGDRNHRVTNSLVWFHYFNSLALGSTKYIKQFICQHRKKAPFFTKQPYNTPLKNDSLMWPGVTNYYALRPQGVFIPVKRYNSIIQPRFPYNRNNRNKTLRFFDYF